MATTTRDRHPAGPLDDATLAAQAVARRHAIGDLLRRSAARDPDRIAIVYRSVRQTYAELDETVNRTANALAERGVRVTGLDTTPRFLELASEDAATRGLDVEYVHGDMRSLPWSDRFDRVLNWFTSFGYFADDDNRRVLAETNRALTAGGRLAIENNNAAFILRNLREHDIDERDGNFMLERREFDPVTSRMMSERVVIRDGDLRRSRFFVRMFGFPELRDWLLDAGYASVTGCDWEGEPLTMATRRMVTLARK